MVKLIQWLILPLLLTAGTACRAADTAHRAVSLVLHWDHQAQFAGYYMALDKGFYADAGLDVTIVRGGPDGTPCEDVGRGRATFCTTMLSTALEKRDGGMPLVLLAQVVNRSNFEVVAWRRPGGENGPEIRTPADLNGRRATIWPGDFRPPYEAFLEAQDVRPEVLPQYYTLSLFLHHGVDACSAMRYNEYHWLLQHGVREEDLVVFPLCDFGVPLPEDGIYTLESTWESDPALCRAFAKASLKGWEYARDHREEALDAVMRRVTEANLPTNRPHMSWMLNEILASTFPAENAGWRFGRLSPEAFQASCNMLLRHDAIKTAPDYTNFAKGALDDDVEP
ncbi:MAG TPA: ABC transporter substrate-binding protein [Opitutales bacterium]|nr:ABC transporter substrate-binding protein [Opitutales bacterium]